MKIIKKKIIIRIASRIKIMKRIKEKKIMMILKTRKNQKKYQ